MTIEAAVLLARMSKDRTADLVLVPHLLSIAKTIRQLLSIRLAECAVEPGQDQLLLCLSDQDHLTGSEIAERLFVRPSTISKMTDRLCRNGWVIRTNDIKDHRRVRVGLTADGKAIVETIRGIHVRLDQELQDAFGPDAALASSLEQISGVLDGRLRRLR